MNLIEGATRSRANIVAATLFSLFGPAVYVDRATAGVKERYVETQAHSIQAQKPGLLQSFRAIAGNRPLFILCIANLCTLCGAFNVKLASQVYYTQYVLNDPILLVVDGLFQHGLYFHRRVHTDAARHRYVDLVRRRSISAACWFGLLGDLLNYFFGGGSVSFVAFSCLAFFGSAFVNSLNWALVSDTVEYGEWRTGVRSGRHGLHRLHLLSQSVSGAGWFLPRLDADANWLCAERRTG